MRVLHRGWPTLHIQAPGLQEQSIIKHGGGGNYVRNSSSKRISATSEWTVARKARQPLRISQIRNFVSLFMKNLRLGQCLQPIECRHVCVCVCVRMCESRERVTVWPSLASRPARPSNVLFDSGKLLIVEEDIAQKVYLVSRTHQLCSNTHTHTPNVETEI